MRVSTSLSVVNFLAQQLFQAVNWEVQSLVK